MDRKKFIEQTANVVRKAYQFSIKSRKQDIDDLRDDAAALIRNDVFELGMRLTLESGDFEFIDGILTGMISREKDETAKRLKTIQKEAVLSIQKSFNSFELLNTLFSYIDDNEKEEIRKLLTEDEFKNYFELY